VFNQLVIWNGTVATNQQGAARADQLSAQSPDRRTTAAARSSTRMNGSFIMRWSEDHRRVRPDEGKNDIRGAKQTVATDFGAQMSP
jgi:hypothetical protein